jgi:nitroreductase
VEVCSGLYRIYKGNPRIHRLFRYSSLNYCIEITNVPSKYNSATKTNKLYFKTGKSTTKENRMAMIELLRTRRSVRKYKNSPLDKKTTDLFAEALLRSPSSRGFNSWEFIFVDDKELLQGLSRAKPVGVEFLAFAALAIVILGNDKKTDVWIEDCSIAAINVQLLAHDLGLGSCWGQIRLRPHDTLTTAEAYVQTLLGIPKNLRVNMIVGIGFPDESPEPISKEKLNFKKIHLNRF